MQARTIVDDKNKSYNNEMYMLCMHSTVAVIEMLRRSAMNKKEMHENVCRWIYGKVPLIIMIKSALLSYHNRDEMNRIREYEI